jgi:hypothetical protein
VALEKVGVTVVAAVEGAITVVAVQPLVPEAAVLPM